MSTLCKQSRKKKTTKHDSAKLESLATHRCKKCKRLACAKKVLCKPKKR